MHRQNSKAFCLLLALAACLLLAQARPNRRHQMEPSGYGQRDNEHYRGKEPHHRHHDASRGPYEHEEYKEYSYSEHDSYEGRGGQGPDSYHSEEHYEQSSDSGPGYHHREEHYDKLDVKTFTMQETSRVVDDTNLVPLSTSKFRCSKEEDEPDFCLHPSYPDKRYGDDYSSNNFLEDVLAENNAATCTWKTTAEMCPSHILGTCISGAMNCTITAVSEKCGCPYKGGLVFTAKGYFSDVTVNSCTENYDPTAVPGRRRLASADGKPYSLLNATTVYNGTAWVFRGKIDSVVTREGAKEVKGNVEFVSTFTAAGPGTAATHYGHGSEQYYHGERDSGHSRGGERDSGPYHGSGERDSGYYHGERERDSGYYGSDKKVFIKGGSLKVTVVEAMHY